VIDSGSVILALGGGGARGLAHVGVLQAIERAGLEVSGIAGTSMGGLIGSLRAACIAPDEIEAAILRLATPREMMRLVDLGLGSYGLSVKGVKIYDLLAEMLGAQMTFDDLCMPFAVTSIDLNSGREVVLRDGLVAEAVRSTISIPGVFEPVSRGAMRLVDGGPLNNLPVDVARTLGDDPVVAVDVMPQFRRNTVGEQPIVLPLELTHLPNLLKDTVATQNIMVSEMTAMRLDAHPPERLVTPELPADVSVLVGFHRAEEIIEAGRRSAELTLAEW
jgi:NTE family protein